ncbi:MAG: SRPBCC domain-containing protein [Sphingobacteriia bacterium]|nr:SRPBCC domain-containing protein [Sphingobacteriia bacterium]
MTTILQTNYEKDLLRKKILVNRTFNAPLEVVWEAWTDKDILDRWWAPKPWTTKTKSMNFTEGGHWLYGMMGPGNETHWCRVDYIKIVRNDFFTGKDCFCDEDGNINNSLPSNEWKTVFTAVENGTRVDVEISFTSEEQLKQIVEMGFEQGFAMAHQNLDQYIQQQVTLWIQNKTGNKARVATYLNFPGNTEEAMNFYKSVFGTEFIGSGIQRFGDIPASTGHPPVAENVKKMVLHVELPITGNHILMATDAPKEMGFTVTTGNNMHISVELETRVETNRIFEALSKGGNITMPLADMFWGAYFGSCTDKYGVNWMFNCTSKD